LSKAFLSGERTAEDLALRPPSFWVDSDVDVLCGRTVTLIDADRHHVILDDGTCMGYGKLVWATGGEPRPLPGTEGVGGVHTFRTLADAIEIKAAIGAADDALVVGGGFIGLEAAAAFRRAGVSVDVVETQPRLLARVTSAPISDYFADLHRSAGVRLHLSTGIESISSLDGQLHSVTLDSGEIITPSVLLVGIGLLPNSAILECAGATASNGIDVDNSCRTNLPDVYAIGDVANFVSPYAASDSRVRLESVPNTTAHALACAADIIGAVLPSPPVPWFWSHQYETKLQTAGLIHGYDREIVRGDPSGGRFSVVYLQGSRMLGVDAVNNVKDFVAAKNLLGCGAHLDAELVANSDLKLADCVAVTESIS
jgi:3-phenylpropionate/trans-cinnamate dioxygenase ferredoxin reductase subunit